MQANIMYFYLSKNNNLYKNTRNFVPLYDFSKEHMQRQEARNYHVNSHLIMHDDSLIVETTRTRSECKVVYLINPSIVNCDTSGTLS